MHTFLEVAFPTEEPVWFSENNVIYKDQFIKLRCFRSQASGEPVLILPPQAGHSSTIADYDKDQSLVQTVMKNTEGSVYCIDWLPTTKDEDIANLLASVQIAKAYAAGDGGVHLVGLCQGGWLATIYTALNQANVKSLMLVASPIDFHRGGGIIYETITEHGMAPYKAVVDACGGVMKGDMMLLGWKLMHPVDRFYGDYVSIAVDSILGREKELARTKKFRTWYEHTQDIAGTWYLQACEWLFLENRLVEGKLVINGVTVDLSRIKCPVVMVAGEKDDITLPSHLFAITDFISSLETVKLTIPDCGHIGCFMGRKSQGFIAKAVRWRDGIN